MVHFKRLSTDLALERFLRLLGFFFLKATCEVKHSAVFQIYEYL